MEKLNLPFSETDLKKNNFDFLDNSISQEHLVEKTKEQLKYIGFGQENLNFLEKEFASKDVIPFKMDKPLLKERKSREEELKELSDFCIRYHVKMVMKAREIKKKKKEENIKLNLAQKKLSDEKRKNLLKMIRSKHKFFKKVKFTKKLTVSEKNIVKLPSHRGCLSIAQSKFTQKYGEIFNRRNNNATCMHCDEKKHTFKIVSSRRASRLVESFQTSFQKENFLQKINENKEVMVGGAIVKQCGKVIGQYITHSGDTSERIKDVYRGMKGGNVKILDYQNTHLNEQIIHPKTVYAIHTHHSMSINKKFLTLYGKVAKEYSPKSKQKCNSLVTQMREKIPAFARCAAQKILQQIAKDFSHLIKQNPQAFEISLSEAWIKGRGPGILKSWSQLHPVSSCWGCVVILPRSLCDN